MLSSCGRSVGVALLCAASAAGCAAGNSPPTSAPHSASPAVSPTETEVSGAESGPSPLGPEEFVISPENIGSFDYAGVPHSVFESIRNTGRNDAPEVWQFRYSPLVLPQFNPDGSLALVETPIGSRMRVILPLTMYTDETQKLAHEAVRVRYPDQSGRIREGNVTPLPLRRMEIHLPELALELPTAKLVNAEFDVLNPPREISVMIDLASAGDVAILRSLLASTPIQYTIFLNAKTAKNNTVQVSFQDLRRSSLFATLDGTGAQYIHRDDARDLMENFSKQISQRVIIERPDQFEAAVFEQVLGRLLASSDEYDASKFASTYNAQDLHPDVLTKTLDKMFTKETGKDSWKHTGNFELEGKAGVVGVLNAESKVKGAFTTEGLKEFLKQHDITAEFEGNKIVAKQVRVRRVNTGAFKADGNFTNVMTFVQQGPGSLKGGVDMSYHTRNRVGAASALARLQRLETESQPVGTVVASMLSWDQFARVADTTVWKPADGKAAPAGSAYASRIGPDLPDLRGMFVRGLNSVRAGEIRSDGMQDPEGSSRKPGLAQNDALGRHGHGIADPGHDHRVAGGFSINNANSHRRGGGEHTSGSLAQGEHRSSGNPSNISVNEWPGVETRPKNAAVFYYVKVQ
jgi:hypothetical protein